MTLVDLPTHNRSHHTNTQYAMETLNKNTAVSGTDLELKRNFVFCGGIGNPEFYPADFDNKSEETVLFTRVSLGLKPIASIVMQPSWNTEDRIKMVRTARELGLTWRLIINEWGAAELLITAMPDTTLGDLLAARSLEHRFPAFQGRLLSPAQARLTVRSFMSGFDMSSHHPKHRVTETVSGLLLGYPLRIQV